MKLCKDCKWIRTDGWIEKASFWKCSAPRQKKAFPYLQESPWKKKVIVSLCVLMDFSNPDSIILVVKQVAGSNQSKVHDNT